MSHLISGSWLNLCHRPVYLLTGHYLNIVLSTAKYNDGAWNFWKVAKCIAAYSIFPIHIVLARAGPQHLLHVQLLFLSIFPKIFHLSAIRILIHVYAIIINNLHMLPSELSHFFFLEN